MTARAEVGAHVRVDAKGQTFEFDCAPGERILHAGLRAGIALPYECASGTCGTCKAGLVEGDTASTWPQAPGHKYLKAERNELLMCQTVAHTDCTLTIGKRIGTIPEGRFLPLRTSGTIENLRDLAPDVVSFDVALDEPMSFDAGQFVLFEVDDVPGARSYSMVNYARDTRRLSFVVKRFAGGGISNWLFGGSVAGHRARVFGPLGSATFDATIAKHLLCLAGGSGIAGMMSILTRAAGDRYFERHDGQVFFGVRTARDVFYLAELAAFARRFPERLRVTIALSHEEAPPDLIAAYPELRFDSGFVHEAAKRAIAPPLLDTMAYVAGPPPMVDASLRLLLLEAKLSGTDIRYDKFS